MPREKPLSFLWALMNAEICLGRRRNSPPVTRVSTLRPKCAARAEEQFDFISQRVLPSRISAMIYCHCFCAILLEKGASERKACIQQMPAPPPPPSLHPVSQFSFQFGFSPSRIANPAGSGGGGSFHPSAQPSNCRRRLA